MFQSEIQIRSCSQRRPRTHAGVLSTERVYGERSARRAPGCCCRSALTDSARVAPTPRPLHATGGARGTLALSYGQLQRQAAALAAELLLDGARERTAVGTGVVAVLLDEAPGSVVAELAVMYAGSAFAPLDPGAPVARLCYQLADCEAFALIHSRAQSAQVQDLLKEDACGVLAIELEATVEATAYNLSAGAGVPTKAEAAAAVQSSDACHVIYTSGSTGNPKGVVCEHGALKHYADAKLQSHDIDDRAHVLLVSAATWDPSVGDAFSTLACGATLAQLACAAGAGSIGRLA